MKISQSLHKKIKEPHFIGFTSASIIYLSIAFVLLDRPSMKNIKLKQNGNHSISLQISSIDNKGNQTQSIKKPIPSMPKPIPQAIPKATPKAIPAIKPQKTPDTKPKKSVTEHKEFQKSHKAMEQQQSNLHQTAENQTQTLAHHEGIEDEFLSKIRSAIYSNNRYPRSARIKKLQGEVVVEFVLSQHGVLEDLKIIQSNAEKILQNSALKAVEKAAKHFPKPHQTLRIRVPIIYNLKA